MNKKFLLPLFLILVVSFGFSWVVNSGHAVSTIAFVQQTPFAGSGNNIVNGVNTLNFAMSNVGKGNVLIVNVYGIGAFSGWTVTDTQSNTYTSRVTSLTGSGSGLTTVIYTTTLSLSGSDTITVATGGPTRSYASSISEYSGVTGFGTTATFENDVIGNTGSTTATVSLSGVNLNSWIVENTAIYLGGLSLTMTFNNNQISRNSNACNNVGYNCQPNDVGASSSSFTLSVTGTGTGCSGNAAPCGFVSDSALELTGNAVSSTTTVTTCYGECGNPPITLINTNATHTINFNQSYTIFYEFQSNLNGVVLNVTTNVGKNYVNGQQIGLGLWTASCGVGQQPFSTQCAGTLQPGALLSNPNIQKGKFSIKTNVGVNVGEWIGIGVTGVYSGLDLNSTNGTCGDINSICVAPMMYTRGTIPQIIFSASQCNVNPSPCNIGSINSVGLWTWIQGNIVTGAPPPIPSIGCINVDLSCFIVASACGLTPSNCFIGGGIIFTIYFMFFVIGIVLAISYVNREYETQLHFPPSLFFLFFLISLFMFTAMGLIPQYVTIVVFILTALGVAGYFGAGFMGRSHRE